MNNNLVSVIMPSFNSEEFIKESIDSIQKQSYGNWELVIVDDGSVDSTMDIVSRYIANDSRIVLYKNSKKGVSSARNLGIDNAKGDYICFLDSDDLYSKNVIEKRINFMLNNNVSATTCKIVITDKNLGDLGWVMHGKRFFTFEDFHGCPVHTNSVMFKKEVFHTLRFDETFSNGEDWLMWQRIARMGIAFYHIDDCQIFYRQQEGAVRKNFLKHENSLLDVIDIVYGEDIDCPSPLSKYKYGLLNPQKEMIILKRRIGLFNYLLLEKNYSKAEEIGEEILNSKIELKVKDIIGLLKYSTMRYYLCHANSYIGYIKNDKILKKNYKKYFSKHIYKELEKYLFNSKRNRIIDYLKKKI